MNLSSELFCLLVSLSFNYYLLNFTNKTQILSLLPITYIKLQSLKYYIVIHISNNKYSNLKQINFNKHL